MISLEVAPCIFFVIMSISSLFSSILLILVSNYLAHSFHLTFISVITWSNTWVRVRMLVKLSPLLLLVALPVLIRNLKDILQWTWRSLKLLSHLVVSYITVIISNLNSSILLFISLINLLQTTLILFLFSRCEWYSFIKWFNTVEYIKAMFLIEFKTRSRARWYLIILSLLLGA